MSDIEEKEQIEKDIQLIAGGDFSPDSIGPERYEDTVSRVRAMPAKYLDAVEAMYLGTNFNAEQQSEMTLQSLFDLIFDQEPVRIRQISEELLRHFDAMMLMHDQAKDQEALRALLPDDVINLLQRLQIRRMQMRNFLKEKDS